ncbi:OmpA family protein [Georgenia sp. SYP-B2076]|uniref:OmpA family protein n=1 Tax=Georgenia sp. SYP-B2076 TaxID=2495881 RepID=UPI000F8D8ECE|nr:OmpA family protein [Georgenia sp. SYP-B2076]
MSAALLTLALALGGLAPVTATGPEDVPTPTRQELASSVRVLDLSGTVRVLDLTNKVRALEVVETEGSTTTVTLATDILFTPDSSDLPGTAAAKIADLIVDIPQGAAVRIHGHTDSVQGAVDNQQLSTARAEAVAGAVRAARADLRLEVAGFAATRPAVAESAADPSTRAANRRVEIVYGG